MSSSAEDVLDLSAVGGGVIENVAAQRCKIGAGWPSNQQPRFNPRADRNAFQVELISPPSSPVSPDCAEMRCAPQQVSSSTPRIISAMDTGYAVKEDVRCREREDDPHLAMITNSREYLLEMCEMERKGVQTENAAILRQAALENYIEMIQKVKRKRVEQAATSTQATAQRITEPTLTPNESPDLAMHRDAVYKIDLDSSTSIGRRSSEDSMDARSAHPSDSHMDRGVNEQFSTPLHVNMNTISRQVQDYNNMIAASRQIGDHDLANKINVSRQFGVRDQRQLTSGQFAAVDRTVSAGRPASASDGVPGLTYHATSSAPAPDQAAAAELRRALKSRWPAASGSLYQEDRQGSGERDETYWERRRKNNEAAKRSRDSRRAKEEQISNRASMLAEENLQLRAQIAILKTETANLHLMLYNRRM